MFDFFTYLKLLAITVKKSELKIWNKLILYPDPVWFGVPYYTVLPKLDSDSSAMMSLSSELNE